MRHHARQSGFILLMSLVLVLLVGVALASLARRSAVTALQCQESVDRLQRRWAAKSCRASLLHRVPELLERGPDEPGRGREDVGVGPSAAKLRLTVHLAGRPYELVLTDEQAKVNINDLLGQTDRAETQSIARRLVRESDAGGADTVLTPLLPVQDSPGRPLLAAVGGYGQIFPTASPDRLVGSDGNGLADAVTCWGDGLINIHRAPDYVVKSVCDKPLGRDLVAALLAARQQEPGRKLAAMLSGLDEFDAQRKAKVSRFLTDESTCYGLWVIVRGEQRRWYTLAVGVMEDEGPRRDGGQRRWGVRQWYEFSW